MFRLSGLNWAAEKAQILINPDLPGFPMEKVQNLKGMRDFYPDGMSAENYLFGIWRNVARRYGYEEMDGPILEPALLWKLKSGNEIPDQMYAFTDKGGNEIALRPELTPTVARMVSMRQRELNKPMRWFSIPRCFRFEAQAQGIFPVQSRPYRVRVPACGCGGHHDGHRYHGRTGVHF